MKINSNIIMMTAWLAASSLFAASERQEKPEVGFIRIVHAVAPGEGKLNIMVDGEDIFPKGYDLGQRTGGFGIKAGVHMIALKKEGVESRPTQVTLKDDETLTLIGFAEKEPKKKEGDPPVWKTRILRLKQSEPEHGFRMTLVSACDQDEVTVKTVVQGKKSIETASVKRLTTTLMDLGRSRREVLVKAGDEVITTISPEDPGNYVVVLYQGADGKIMALSFYDPKFVIAG